MTPVPEKPTGPPSRIVRDSNPLLLVVIVALGVVIACELGFVLAKLVEVFR